VKILHTEASRGWGGQEIRILNESAGMIARGHEVTIICTPGSNIALEANARNIKVVELPVGKPSPGAVSALRRWLKANPVDVINTHSSADSWIVAGATRLWRDAPKVVRTRHISAPVAQHVLARWLYRRATDHVVTTGEKLRQTLIADNGLPPEQVTSVPTGVDVEHFQPGDRLARRDELGLPKNGVIIGIVATLRSWKGHEILLEAFAELARDDVCLAVVGNGPQRENLKRRIFELGIRRRIFMPGNLNDVRPWLQAMDVFALPSYANEGVPQSIMQAMACELPVVSTPVGSIEELVINGETGMLVAPKNVSALASALDELISNHSLREKFGRAGRVRVENRFTDKVMLDRMEEIFGKVVNGEW